MQSWTEQTAFTSPGPHAPALDAIGADPAAVVAAIQGLLIHGGAVEHYGLTPGAFDRETLRVRDRLDQILALDPRPLTEPRPPQNRVLGTCRDYAALACAIFRHQGRAARVRCGFAAYFGGRPWEDHWLCELWSGGRWRRVDANLDPVLQAALGVGLPADDVPPPMFLTADEAWRLCHEGEQNPETFGHGAEAAGLWFVLVNLVRDQLALADQLTSAWDGWRAAAGVAAPPDAAALALAEEIADGPASSLRQKQPWWKDS